MLHYYRFRQDLFAPQPGRDVYVKRPAGKGWPEECPPIRAANAFGFDLLANFDVTFVRMRSRSRSRSRPPAKAGGRGGSRAVGGDWRVEQDVVVQSDFDYSATEDAPGAPLTQQYAWFWERGQKLPHVITDNVYEQIRNQVKVSSFLFLRTDPNEMLYMTDVPNLGRSWRAMTALVDTDWYPASYPWHCVLELPPGERRVTIRKGEPLCRVIPVRRDTYFAGEMTPGQFDDFFARGQRWLATHGRVQHEEAGGPHAGGGPAGKAAGAAGTVDITRTYVRQQVRSKFVVMT